MSKIHPFFRLLAGLCMLAALLGTLAAGQPPGDPNQLDEAQVRAAVETWVRSVTADARPDAVVERMEPYRLASGSPVPSPVSAYIAHLKGGGFCLAGANRLLLPVYLYVPAKPYFAADVGLQNTLWEVGSRLQYLESVLTPQGKLPAGLLAYQPELDSRSALWDQLIAGQAPKAAAPASSSAAPAQMALPLTSQWDQTSPYNDQAPNLTPGVDERTLTGCVATAMAQMMYYWKWPWGGLGSHSVNYVTHWRTNWDTEYLATDPGIPSSWSSRLTWSTAWGGYLYMSGYWDDSLYRSAQAINSAAAYQAALANLWARMNTSTTVVSANFAGAAYNWNAMQNTHTDPVDDGDSDVAQVMLHLGVSVDMDYGVEWSGSDNWRIVTPLSANFYYDPDVTYGHPDSNLNQSLYVDEIQWLRPVIFGGTGPAGGHSWVLFGYNQGTSPWQYKMNMGWGGSSDGWYSLDNVPSGLVNFRNHVVDMAPLSVVRFVGGDTQGDGSPSAPYRNIETALQYAPNGATLIFKAGSTNTFSAAPLTINRPLTLKGVNATIQK